MSDTSKPVADGATGSAATNLAADAATNASRVADVAKQASKPQNPALKMMGVPRLRLPSRNWMIFLSITGSIAAAVTYDKWQTRKAKDKWCKLVSHFKDQPLDTTSLPRTVTIFLSAPPGDGLRAAREHFHEYVKPILVAAAIDWDVVEGRKEGDVRYKTAERIRRQRRVGGEGITLPPEHYSVENVRKNIGIHKFDGVAGDIVIGRHTWKEYIRGLHEGWLGPVDPPEHVDIAMGTVPEVEPSVTTTPASTNPEPAALAERKPLESLENTVGEVEAAQPQAEETKTDDKKEGEEEEKPKPRQPPPYIAPEAFSGALASRQLPNTLEPSIAVSCPHVLGFRNTPIRLYRFFTRRYLADDIGRQVAAAVLGSSRSYDTVSTIDTDSPSGVAQSQPEQVEALVHEERDWWKTVHQPRKDYEESVLIEPITFDERITSRMRRFELTSDEEQRASAIAAGHDSIVPEVASTA